MCPKTLGGGGDLRIIFLLKNSCSFSGGDNLRWWGHSNPTHNNLIRWDIHIRKGEGKNTPEVLFPVGLSCLGLSHLGERGPDEVRGHLMGCFSPLPFLTRNISTPHKSHMVKPSLPKIYRVWHVAKGSALRGFLLPANEVCEGYVFTHVCLSTGGVSRPTPRGDVEGSDQGGLQAHIRGGCWGVWPGRSPGPHLGGSSPSPHLGGSPGPHPGGYPSMHWGRPPTSRQLLLWVVCILLECILVFLNMRLDGLLVYSGVVEIFTVHNVVAARYCFHKRLWFCSQGCLADPP